MAPCPPPDETVTMGFLDRGRTRLHYIDQGLGPAIVATHGVAENHLYWTLPGIAERLVGAGYRFIAVDMRGHGRSGAEAGGLDLNVETIAGDFDAVADHLGLERFHLLSHATGGMAALRYAMGARGRLLSLMSTNTGAATWPTDEGAELGDPAHASALPPARPNTMAKGFRGQPWVAILQHARSHARVDPFLNRMHLATDPEAAFRWYEACLRLGDPDSIADFLLSFYTDPDPHLAALRGIRCPNLVVAAEHDRLFLKPSLQLAREIPGARLATMAGRGHMTAFEDPDGLAGILLDFLGGL